MHRMQSRLSYCSECREEHADLLCVECKQKFHKECIGNAIFQAKAEPNYDREGLHAKEFVCPYCVANPIGEEEREAQMVIDAARNKRIKAVQQTYEILSKAKANYLKESRALFLPFCAEVKLNEIIRKYSKSKTTGTFSCSAEQLEQFTFSTKTPSFITNAELRDYQLEGVNKLCSWYLRGVGGILADEMGLGKTIQTIAFLASCKHILGLQGAHLVIVPLAVLHNWGNELHRFAPSLVYRKLYGSKIERNRIFNDDDVQSGQLDVYLTTYEAVMAEEAFFTDTMPWASVILDEGHRIKEASTKLRAVLDRLRSPFRLLLTGTPIQNNLKELWALLNFLLPDLFTDSSPFEVAARIKEDTINQSFCNSAREVLENNMLIRRIKADVELNLLPKKQCRILVSLTPLQKHWYQNILTKFESDLGLVSLLSRSQLLRVISQLRKIVNHPKQLYANIVQRRLDAARRADRLRDAGSEFYESPLIPEPERDTSQWRAEQQLKDLAGEALVQSSGKLQMMDRLLLRLRSNGSRVLIFSQWTETLDILEEYLSFRFGPKGELFFRLDGSDNKVLREVAVRSFNRPQSTAFAFLISTTAGGMGINLATADSVVLFDSHSNPQVDLQAQDRAHRIGQKKQVTVYRLVAQDTFEEKLLEYADRKLVLDKMIIANASRSQPASEESKDLDQCSITELVEALSVRPYQLSSGAGNSGSVQQTVFELDNALTAFISSAQMSQPVEGSLSCAPISLACSSSASSEIEQSAIDLTETSSTSHDILSTIDSGSLIKPLPPSPQNVVEISDSSPDSDSDASDGSNEIVPVGDSRREGKRAVKAPKRYEPVGLKLRTAKVARRPEKVCFCCNKRSEELTSCIQCPKSYHIECILSNTSASAADFNGRGFRCPWHTCLKCGTVQSAAGGILFRCMTCPTALCFDCWPQDQELQQLNPSPEFIQNFVLRGYPLSANNVFYRCDQCDIKKSSDSYINVEDRSSWLIQCAECGQVKMGTEFTKHGATAEQLPHLTKVKSAGNSLCRRCSDSISRKFRPEQLPKSNSTAPVSSNYVNTYGNSVNNGRSAIFNTEGKSLQSMVQDQISIHSTWPENELRTAAVWILRRYNIAGNFSTLVADLYISNSTEFHDWVMQRTKSFLCYHKMDLWISKYNPHEQQYLVRYVLTTLASKPHLSQLISCDEYDSLILRHLPRMRLAVESYLYSFQRLMTPSQSVSGSLGLASSSFGHQQNRAAQPVAQPHRNQTMLDFMMLILRHPVCIGHCLDLDFGLPTGSLEAWLLGDNATRGVIAAVQKRIVVWHQKLRPSKRLELDMRSRKHAKDSNSPGSFSLDTQVDVEFWKAIFRSLPSVNGAFQVFLAGKLNERRLEIEKADQSFADSSISTSRMEVNTATPAENISDVAQIDHEGEHEAISVNDSDRSDVKPDSSCENTGSFESGAQISEFSEGNHDTHDVSIQIPSSAEPSESHLNVSGEVASNIVSSEPDPPVSNMSPAANMVAKKRDRTIMSSMTSELKVAESLGNTCVCHFVENQIVLARESENINGEQYFGRILKLSEDITEVMEAFTRSLSGIQEPNTENGENDMYKKRCVLVAWESTRYSIAGAKWLRLDQVYHVPTKRARRSGH